MRFNNLIKAIPFFSIFLLILILSISNQNKNTKLRILIWNTPSLSLGSYLAISTGTGFILAYSITRNLAKLNNYQQKQQLIFKDNNKYAETNEDIDKPMKAIYDNTLIERDIKDPSPTITANFRIIGRKERSYNDFLINNIQDDESFESEDQYHEQPVKEEYINKVNSNSTDWNDQSFSDW